MSLIWITASETLFHISAMLRVERMEFLENVWEKPLNVES